MLSWLDKFWDNVTGNVGAAVSKAVKWAMHASIGVFLSVFGLVGTAWAKLQAGFGDAWSLAARFARDVANWAAYIWRVVIPAVERWVAGLAAELGRTIAAAWSSLERGITSALAWVSNELAAAYRWVLANVWAPLRAGYDWLWGRVKDWAYTAWYLVTHPAALAELLWLPLLQAVEANAWQAAALLGRFLLALIVRNLGRLAALAEDILTAVL